MVSVFASSGVDRGFEHRSGQNIKNKIYICCISAKHLALRRTTKDYLARNRDSVPEWGDRAIHGLLIHREEFEDTKGVIRIRTSMKNRQHNGQKKNVTRTNNDLQTNT